eukprot:TRINITY_DN104865_c0_g1_i1.p2 TRINITY_DN104865_c0_g1~~TRINITY_DN104865_c0_g1_i1.p2  ORF type:complete len:111 (-),score=7.45 TRINITY_DN104865_c0_g1_i1:517-849(-)
MRSDEAVGRVWRFPTYYQGGYDKNCPVQATIVECFREIVPPRIVHRDDVVAGGVRDIAKLKRRRVDARRHSTEPPKRSAGPTLTNDQALRAVPPPGPKPVKMRPRSTTRP